MPSSSLPPLNPFPTFQTLEKLAPHIFTGDDEDDDDDEGGDDKEEGKEEDDGK